MATGLWSCGVLAQSISQIREVQSRPEVDSVVYLQGTVGDRIPLVEGQVYQLRDETGTIWVVTSNTTTQTGAPISIKGKVKFQSIPLAGQEQGEVYIEEMEQLANSH